MANTIKLKKYSDIIEEYPANAAITPGHLIELGSNGKVLVHNSAGENVLPMFALEDELQGRGINTAFAADEPVQCWVAGRGDIVNAILTTSQTVVVGDFLESAGNGTLQKHVPNTDSAGGNIYGAQLVGVAVAAVTTTSAVARIAVRIV